MEEVQRILDEIGAGKTATISRTITAVENCNCSFELLDRLYQLPKRSFIIGVTGSPGSGKSTFVNQLVQHGVGLGQKVAIVAIDPSSPFTGGALLGDRIRFADNLPLDKFFFRSLASRTFGGAVSHALFGILQIFNAAHFDWIIVESVGAGQGELDIKNYADIVLMLLVSGMGDEIQCMKAGIMEIADLFIINKIDTYAPNQLYLALKNQLCLRVLEGEADQRILQTDALHGTGFPELLQVLENFRSSSHYQERNAEHDAQLLINNEITRFFQDHEVQERLQKLSGRGSPYRIANRAQVLLNLLLRELSKRETGEH